MVQAQIEKDVFIEAPIDAVWRILTEPGQMQQWLSTEAELDGRPGGAGRLRFPSGETYYLQVDTFEPPRRFSYRWMHPSGTLARPENSMLVEFTLRSEGGGTRLRVVESGFDHIDWTEAAKEKFADDHSRGWPTLLGRLRDYAPRAGMSER